MRLSAVPLQLGGDGPAFGARRCDAFRQPLGGLLLLLRLTGSVVGPVGLAGLPEHEVHGDHRHGSDSADERYDDPEFTNSRLARSGSVA
jgi:hypothetical protein